jgi:tRNA(Ile)-lysidine synthase
MTIKNFCGHKKIKDIFINEKIGVKDRLNQPVVVDSNDNIIWLPGIKKSLFDSQEDGKYDIILEYGLRKESL